MKSSLRGCRIAGWRVRGHRTACRNPGRLDTDRRGAGRGRVIPHANRLETSTLAALALPVAVVEPTFGALPVAPARAPQALRAGFGRAAWAAVDVAPVAAPADGEHVLAARASRQPQRRLRGIHGLRSVPTRNTAADAPRSTQTCDNPGWSSLCAFEDRGSSTRGSGARYSGSSLASGDGRPHAGPHALEGRRCAPRPDLRPGEGRAPLGQRPLDQEEKNPCPGGPLASVGGEMLRKRHFYVIVNTPVRP
jgi:hypothetical protein